MPYTVYHINFLVLIHIIIQILSPIYKIKTLDSKFPSYRLPYELIKQIGLLAILYKTIKVTNAININKGRRERARMKINKEKSSR